MQHQLQRANTQDQEMSFDPKEGVERFERAVDRLLASEGNKQQTTADKGNSPETAANGTDTEQSKPAQPEQGTSTKEKDTEAAKRAHARYMRYFRAVRSRAPSAVANK